jgi:hypothetical protein
MQRTSVFPGRSQYAALRRQEITARNATYAALNRVPYVTSYGDLPVVVYQQSECGRHHGNFISASYQTILKQADWRRRLQKVHSQGKRSLPKGDRIWRELDSSTSSDALLMNIFCYPGVARRQNKSLICTDMLYNGKWAGSRDQVESWVRSMQRRDLTIASKKKESGRLLMSLRIVAFLYSLRPVDFRAIRRST